MYDLGRKAASDNLAQEWNTIPSNSVEMVSLSNNGNLQEQLEQRALVQPSNSGALIFILWGWRHLAGTV